ncbi:hypothetical protein Tco_0909637 [Tanacetum coccineum]|uniref:Uncharacterized protein n=1 Tax=Tanacetum coccineum TaxID=301880 RepID=A0ABQ5CSI6_9ASTR
MSMDEVIIGEYDLRPSTIWEKANVVVESDKTSKAKNASTWDVAWLGPTSVKRYGECSYGYTRFGSPTEMIIDAGYEEDVLVGWYNYRIQSGKLSIRVTRLYANIHAYPSISGKGLSKGIGCQVSKCEYGG